MLNMQIMQKVWVDKMRITTYTKRDIATRLGNKLDISTRKSLVYTDEVFNVINKEEEYPQFMPRFTDVKYLYTDDNFSYYTFHIGLPLNIKYQYKIKIKEFQNQDIAWITWELVDWEHLINNDDNFKNKLQVIIQKEFKITPDYVELENARLLSESEYTLNTNP